MLLRLLLLIVLFGYLSPAFSAKIPASLDDGKLSFECDGVKILNAFPKADLLLGENKQRVQWSPNSAPETTRQLVETPLGPAEQTTLAWTNSQGFKLEWIITQLKEVDGLTLQVRLTNTGETRLLVKQLDVLNVPNGSLTVTGEEADWMSSSRYLKYHRFYEGLADLRKRGQLIRDQSDPSDSQQITREVPFSEDFCLYKNDGKQGLSISAVTDQAYNWVTLNVPADSDELGLIAYSEMTGILVDPGESRLSERVLVQAGPWKAAGDRAVAWMRTVLKPRDTPPVYGWCSWYCLGMNVTEEHCFDVADFIKGRQDRYPFETMQVDEGWHIGRHEWYPNEKFKSGTRELTKRFKAAGDSTGNCSAGVWMTPISPDSQRIIDGKLVQTQGKGGTGVRSFDPSWYVGYRIGKPATGKIDPSSPGGAEYIWGELRRLHDLGYRYFKTDFSQVPAMERGYHNPKLTSFQAQRVLYGLMREAIGEESYLLACNGGPARVICGLADATRIGTDSGTKWHFCANVNKYDKPGNVHGAWFPIVQIGCASAYTKLMACDPDVTRLDNLGYAIYDPRFNGRDPRDPSKPMPVKLSMQSVQTFHGIQGLYGGTMMVSDLMYEEGYQTDNRLRMAEIMQPVTPEHGYNFAGGSDVLNHQFGFQATRPWGDWVSMVTWNPDHRGRKDLKIDNAPVEKIGERFHLWSFWDEKYLGVQDASYVFEETKHYHSKLLRLTPVADSNVPTLVGSNLHMAMGATEIKLLESSPAGMTIELVPSAGAIEGQLVIFSEKPMKLNQAVGCQALVTKSDDNVYTVLVTRRERGSDQRLMLETANTEPPSLESIKQSAELKSQWEAGSMIQLLD